MLSQADPARAEELLARAQQAVDQRWRTYEERATAGAVPPPSNGASGG
jgi:pyruvate-ferredoxin/flavodoxin oxidoreductase